MQLLQQRAQAQEQLQQEQAKFRLQQEQAKFRLQQEQALQARQEQRAQQQQQAEADSPLKGRLRAFKRRKGFTQAQTGQLLGFSATQISYWFNDVRLAW